MRMATAKFNPAETVDFVIVGSGAAGGVMARELSRAGFRIVVLEQGPDLREKDFQHDEFKYIFQNAIVNDWKTEPNTFRKTESEKANIQPAMLYGRCVGGGTVHFTANYWRFREVDFIERSKVGPIAGAGLADWPITYKDLEPYYTKVDWEIGVSGEPGPSDPWRSKPYPLPPVEIKSSGALLERGARKLGWHPQPAPMAILSRDYQGRNACVHCGYCESFGCEVGAKSSVIASMIPQAEKTGRCEIRANSYVREISTGSAGRVTGVVYFDAQKGEVFQKANAVVVCANGAQTPRLLLLSKSPQFPNGLANSSGLVGKYLMFNGAGFAFAQFDEPLNEYKSVVVTRALFDFYELDPKLGLHGGGGMDMRFELLPINFALNGLPPDAPRWGAEYKKQIAENFTRSVNVFGHCTSLPVESNSISLDLEVKDAWGLPVVRITYKDHPEDLKTEEFFRQRGLELLEAAGAKRKWSFPPQEQQFGVHLLGTCRMGNDPKTSVINTDHRAHDVPNLFLCDGSSLVTGGRGQPTMTIQALAFRAADRIIALAKRGELKTHRELA